jgi:heme exporter protein C
MLDMENTPALNTPLAKLNALIEYLANPTRFMWFSGKILPWLIAATAITLTYGLYLAWFKAPFDYQQGHTVKIMFIHVPLASLGMIIYGLIAVSSMGSLIWRHPLADVSAKAALPIGAVFTFLALVTGSLWGKPMWGTYWVWDARLTSMLILFFLYLGLMAVWEAIDDHSRAGRAAAILAIVGAINLPIIKFSVVWWNSLHQPASIKPTGISIHSSILTPLLVMWAGMTLLFVVLHLKGMRAEVLRRKVEAMQLRRVERANRS